MSVDPLWYLLREHARALHAVDRGLYAHFRDNVLPLGWANLVDRTRHAALEDLARRLAELEGVEDLETELAELVEEAKGLSVPKEQRA